MRCTEGVGSARSGASCEAPLRRASTSSRARLDLRGGKVHVAQLVPLLCFCAGSSAGTSLRIVRRAHEQQKRKDLGCLNLLSRRLHTWMWLAREQEKKRLERRRHRATHAVSGSEKSERQRESRLTCSACCDEMTLASASETLDRRGERPREACFSIMRARVASGGGARGVSLFSVLRRPRNGYLWVKLGWCC